MKIASAPWLPWAAVLAGALMLCWPAAVNGYPLITPDTIAYVTSGKPIFQALLHPFSEHRLYARFEFYDLGIYFLHFDRWLWPVIALNAVITSLILWYLVRFEVRANPVRAFLAIIAFLSLTTGLSWYASSVLTDAFGSLAYIALYLIVFHWERLSKGEIWMLAAVAWWGIVAHTTHLLISMGLCVVFVLLTVLPWKLVSTRRRHALLASGIVVFALLSQLCFHLVLYGKATLNGSTPPFLMARVISDGTGARYLKEHCSQLNWTICKHVNHLPERQDIFLWEPGGVWDGSSDADKESLLNEEKPFVKATLLAYPRAQLRRSLYNFREQMVSIGLYESTVRYPWLTQSLSAAVNGSQVPYERSRQAKGSLPADFFTDAQGWVCVWTAAAVLVLVPLAWTRGRRDKLPLAITIASVLVLNAAVCGVLSGISLRYQGRIIYLIPLLAILLSMDLFMLRPADHEAPLPR